MISTAAIASGVTTEILEGECEVIREAMGTDFGDRVASKLVDGEGLTRWFRIVLRMRGMGLKLAGESSLIDVVGNRGIVGWRTRSALVSSSDRLATEIGDVCGLSDN
jgi:hypothetical protein